MIDSQLTQEEKKMKEYKFPASAPKDLTVYLVRNEFELVLEKSSATWRIHDLLSTKTARLYGTHRINGAEILCTAEQNSRLEKELKNYQRIIEN